MGKIRDERRVCLNYVLALPIDGGKRRMGGLGDQSVEFGS
jgi:hypothetical protein